MALGPARRANSSPLDIIRALMNDDDNDGGFLDGAIRGARKSNPIIDALMGARVAAPNWRSPNYKRSSGTTNLPIIREKGKPPGPRRELPLPGGGIAGSGGSMFEKLAGRLRDAQGRAQYANRQMKSPSALGNTVGGAKGIWEQMRSAGGQSQGSLLDQYFEQINAMQSPTMDLDPEQMARDQYAPQFQLLDQLRSQTETRGNANANSVQQLYQALANQVRGEGVARTQSQYKDSGAELENIHNTATGSVQGAAQESNADMAAIMQRLGIGEAAPDALEHVEQERSRAINSLAGRYQANASANTGFGQNMVDYQQNTANTSDMAGANAKADTLARLGELLAGYDNKRLDLTGQQEATENQYAMQIAGMQGDAFSSQQENLWRQMEAAIEQQRWEAEFGNTVERGRADDEFNARKFAAEQAAAASEIGGGSNKYTNDPVGHATAIAAQLFPPNAHSNNPRLIQNSVAGIQDTIAEYQPRSLSDLYRRLDDRFPGNPYRSQYREIAAALWKASGGF